MSKILIIGDSFVGKGRPIHDSWVDILKDNFNSVYVDGQPSRDVQTILDKWTCSISNLNFDDFLIIMLPTFLRTRLPLNETHFWDDNLTGNITPTNRFIGIHKYQPSVDLIDVFESEIIDDFNKTIRTMQLINISKAASLNYLDIINSLYEITPCKVLIFSWDEMDIKLDMIEDKSKIQKNLGHLGTSHDEYIKTKGNSGRKHDHHWDDKTHILFANYIKNKLK
jgi:hypothetical protein